MSRVVLDTNLVISTILSPEVKPATILRMVLNTELDLVLSPALLEKISLVLNYEKIRKLFIKRSVTPQKMKDALQKIVKVAIVVSGKTKVNRIDKIHA